MGFKYLGETRREGRHVIRERFRFPHYSSFLLNPEPIWNHVRKKFTWPYTRPHVLCPVQCLRDVL
jgi:hypothetical protein